MTKKYRRLRKYKFPNNTFYKLENSILLYEMLYANKSELEIVIGRKGEHLTVTIQDNGFVLISNENTRKAILNSLEVPNR